jgi:hypothetical protein
MHSGPLSAHLLGPELIYELDRFLGGHVKSGGHCSQWTQGLLDWFPACGLVRSGAK